MDNEFNISIRLSSLTYYFDEFKLTTYSHKYKYFKMGESIFKNHPNSSFKAKTNVFLFSNIYTAKNIDGDCGGGIKKLEPLIKELTSVDNKHFSEINREILVSAQINNEQFGFDWSLEFINFLSKYNYSIGFSGIEYLD